MQQLLMLPDWKHLKLEIFNNMETLIKLYAIIDKSTGKELYYKDNDIVLDTELAITILRTEDMENPHFDFELKCWIDKQNV